MNKYLIERLIELLQGEMRKSKSQEELDCERVKNLMTELVYALEEIEEDDLKVSWETRLRTIKGDSL